MQCEPRRSSMEARRISIGRLITATFAALLTAATAVFVDGSCNSDRRFHEAIDARPMSLDIDLSQPGEFSAPFTQTYCEAHGEIIRLIVESPDGTGRATAEQLAGLDARVMIADADDNRVVDQELAVPKDRAPPEDEGLPLAYFRPFSEGDYTATITVARGAPSLRGARQTLYAQYSLCGLERFAVYILRLLAAICGLPALVLGAIAVRGFVQYGLWKRPRAKDAHAGGRLWL
jgi:hypothetical protein